MFKFERRCSVEILYSRTSVTFIVPSELFRNFFSFPVFFLLVIDVRGQKCRFDTPRSDDFLFC